MSLSPKNPFPLMKCCYFIREEIFKSANPSSVINISRCSKSAVKLIPKIRVIVDISFRINKEHVIMATSETGGVSELCPLEFHDLFDVYNCVILRNLDIDLSSYERAIDLSPLLHILNCFDGNVNGKVCCENLQISAYDNDYFETEAFKNVVKAISPTRRLNVGMILIPSLNGISTVPELHIRLGLVLDVQDLSVFESEVLIVESSALLDISFNRIIRNWMNKEDSKLKYMEIRAGTVVVAFEDNEGTAHLLANLEAEPTEIMTVNTPKGRVSCNGGWTVTASNGKKALFVRTVDTFYLIALP